MYYPYSSSDVNYPTYYSSYWGGYVPYGNGYSKRDATDMYYPYSSSDVNYPTYYSSYWGGYVPYGNGYSKRDATDITTPIALQMSTTQPTTVLTGVDMSPMEMDTQNKKTNI